MKRVWHWAFAVLVLTEITAVAVVTAFIIFSAVSGE